MSRRYGVSISHYQGDVNFHEVFFQNPDLNIEVVIAKASEGEDYQDPKFSEYWHSIKEIQEGPTLPTSHIVRGAYHFLRLTSDPIKQADNFITTIRQAVSGLDNLALSDFCALDVQTVEDFDPFFDPCLSGALQKHLTVFVQRFLQDPLWNGSPPGLLLYTHKNFFDRFANETIGISQEFQDLVLSLPLWVASWQNTQKPTGKPSLPWGWRQKDYTMWQYTLKGRIHGINGDVSMDIIDQPLPLRSPLTGP